MATTARQKLGVTNPELLPQSLEPLEDLPTVELTDLEQYVLARFNCTLDSLSPEVKTIIERTEKYISMMNHLVPIHTVVQGAENQMFLTNTIMRVLGYSGTDLIQGIDLLLYLINKNRNDTFSDSMVYRFFPYVKRSVDDRNTYLKFIEIFLKLSNPLTRTEYAKSDQVRKALTLITPTYNVAISAIITYMNTIAP